MKTTTSPRSLDLVLASASVYRRALLERLGLPFRTFSPGIDESALPHEPPADTALRLAEAKARAAVAANPKALIIGSDQVADCGGQAVGKPHDASDAFEQLKSMRGRTIVFHTALVMINARTGRCQRALVDVASTFRQLDDAALRAYIEREQPYGCAGSVKVEALGIALFSRVASDDPTALIGLPLIRLTDMLITEGIELL